MNTVIQNKSELRKYALEKRKTSGLCGVSEINSKRITSAILNSKEFKNSKNIALYYPIKGEIDITGLLNVKNKNFYLPVCKDNELEFLKYENKLVTGKYSIPEPTGNKINPEELDIIYIPALMANRKCYRLGYGKGYYDRFFAKYKIRAKKIIVVANELINDTFVQDSNDYRCDMVLSENSLIFA